MKTFVRLALAMVFAITAYPLAAPKQAAPQAPAPARNGTALERELPKANYDLASRWTSAKIGKLVFSTSITPHWLEFSDRFWYNYETPAGMKWWIVDPVKKAKVPMFDHAKLASQLTRMLRTPYDAQHLPFTTVKFIKNDTAIQFSVQLPRESKVEDETGKELDGMTTTDQDEQQGGRGGRGAGRGGGGGQGGRAGGAGGQGGGQNQKRWWLEYTLATGTLTLDENYQAERPTPTWASLSPDKQTIVFARGQNLFMMDAKNYELALKRADDPAIQEVQLTTDGERDYSYAGGGGQGGQQQQDDDNDDTETGRGGQAARAQSEADKKFGPRVAAGGVSWSQDNKRFAMTRQDRRKVSDLWVINSLANPRPRLETYKYGMPGEANQPQVEAHVFDVTAKARTTLKTAAFKDQTMSLPSMPLTNLQREKQDTASRWIAVGTDKMYFSRTSRDMKRVDIVEADTKTGESRVVITERLNTYIETKPLRLLMNGEQLIHWSERDGWGHFYLYDSTGKMVRQITSGEFVVNSIEAVDEKNRVMYVTAVGREPEEDPYYVHLYRVNIDTGEIKLLNPGVGSHSVAINDKMTYFLDTWSRVDTAPMTVALRHDGQQGARSREDGRLGAAGAGLQVPRDLLGEGRRRRHGSLRRHVQAVRLRPGEALPDHRVRLPGSADRKRDQDVLAAPGERHAGAVRLHRHGSGQPRRQPAAVEVVPQLRLRQPARLRARRQEDRDRTARQAASVDRRHARRHLRPLGRRVHVDGGDVRLSRLLQGRRVDVRQPRQQRLQPRPGARSTTASRKSSTRKATSPSSTTSTRTRTSPRT